MQRKLTSMVRKLSPLLIVLACPAWAIQEHVSVYKYKSVDGVTSFSDIEPINTPYQKVNFDCYACQVDSLVDWRTTKLFESDFNNSILKHAVLNGVDPALVKAVIHAESHFNAKAVSKQGAQGLMQLMPETAKSLGVSRPFDAQQNISGGTKHLARLLTKYHGDIEMATAAYNAGEGAVRKYKGIPPFPETRVYVQRVAILHQRYKALTSS